MEIICKNKAVKTFHARKGPNHVFGEDVDFRPTMDDTQAIERFDKVWANFLKRAVSTATPCDAEYARNLLPPKMANFFREEDEHRDFWLAGGLFLAQLSQVDDSTMELNQLWFIRSSDRDPRVLFINFDTVELRECFHQAAVKLGYNDEELGKKVLMDLMDTVLKQNPR